MTSPKTELSGTAGTGKRRGLRPISNLRWWIGGVLFASTVINYLDRQTLSLLAPYLKVEYHWTNTDYANIVIGFRIAYSIGQTVFGRFMDRLGTRRGLSLSVIFYSLVSILTSLARGFYSFVGFRFLLGAGESANWPAATKAVSEWFPSRERGLATALFDSGSSIGGAISPWLVLWIYFRWGWRPAFAIPGMLGFLWLLLWRWIYHPPESHPRISEAERQLILADKLEFKSSAGDGAPLPWRDLLKLPQTWGTIIARAFTDPVWYFRHRLVSDLPGGQRYRAKERAVRHLASFSGGGSGKLLWRWSIRLFDQAGMVARSRAKGSGHLRRNRRHCSYSEHFHFQHLFTRLYCSAWRHFRMPRFQPWPTCYLLIFFLARRWRP